MNRSLLCLMILVFINVVGIALPYLVLAPMFINGGFPMIFGFSPIMTVMFILALYPLGQFFGSPIIGTYSDIFGARSVLLVSMAISSVGYLVSGYALSIENLLMLCFSRFLTGFSEGNFGVLRAEVAKIPGSSIIRVKNFGYFHAAATLGWVVGPVLGSFFSNSNVHQGFDSSTPFFLGALICLLGFILVLVNMKQETKKLLGTHKNLVVALRNVWKLHGVREMLLLSFLITLSIDGFYEFYPAFLSGVLTMDSSDIAISTVFLTVGMIFSQICIAPRLDFRLAHFILPAVGVMGGLTIIGLSSDNTCIVLGFLATGLGIGILTTLVPAFVSERTPQEQQGAVMGSMASLRNLGDAFICFSFGVLGDLNIYGPIIVIALGILIASERFGRISKATVCA